MCPECGDITAGDADVALFVGPGIAADIAADDTVASTACAGVELGVPAGADMEAVTTDAASAAVAGGEGGGGGVEAMATGGGDGVADVNDAVPADDAGKREEDSNGAVTARSPGAEVAGGREEETGMGRRLCAGGTESNTDPLGDEASMPLPAEDGDVPGEALADVARRDWLVVDRSV